jgi:hypothetical protein
MHEEKPVARREFEEEDEDEQVQSKIEAVHRGIKTVQEQLASKSLSSSDKRAAKGLMRELESGFADLKNGATKAERRAVAHRMKETVAGLRQYLEEEEDAPVATHSFEDVETKKQHVVDSINAVESSGQFKQLPSSDRKQVRHTLEHMRAELEEENDVHKLHDKLSKEMRSIKQIMKNEEQPQTHHSSHGSEAFQKVKADVKNIRKSLETSSMDEDAKDEIRSSLSKIESEASRYTTASSSEKSSIHAALKKDMSSLRRQFEEGNKQEDLSTKDFEEKEVEDEEDDE